MDVDLRTDPPPARGDHGTIYEGQIISGKYRVDGVLGVGGMGMVASATHVQLGQRVALKFMKPSMVSDVALVERFLREARAAVRLRSEHVTRVLDVGTLDSGAPFIVMEFLDGMDLRKLVKSRGPLPFGEVVAYLVQACDAVAEAHTLGIVHRDLKPHNLFLTHSSRGRPCVKVLDFGIAKALDDSLSSNARIQQGGGEELTMMSTSIGSPQYMAPEQMVSARTVDARADVWALGVCMYQLLTGHTPFEAENPIEHNLKVLQGPPKHPASYRPDLPPDLAAVIMRCLEKDPAWRFANAGDLGAALESLSSIPMPFAPMSGSMPNVPVVHPHSERGVNAQPGMDQRTPPGTGSATGSGTGSGATGPGSLPGRTDISWNALPGALPPEEGRSFAWTVMGGVGLGLVGATAIAAAILMSSGLLASEPKAAGNTGGIDVAQSPPVTETLALPTPTAATAPAAAPAAPATGAPSSSSDKPAAMDVRAPRPPPTSTTGDTPPPVQTAASTAVVAPAASAPAPPPRPAPPKNNGAFDHL